MDDVVYVSPVDKVALLHTGKDKINIDTFRTSYGSSTMSSTRDVLDDTIHYLSPATTGSARTELEGDFYRHFLEYRPPLPPPIPEYGSTISSSISCLEPDLQRTIAIVKPEAMKFKDVVLRTINESGLRIINIERKPVALSNFGRFMHMGETNRSGSICTAFTYMAAYLVVINLFVSAPAPASGLRRLANAFWLDTLGLAEQRVLHLSPEQVSEIYVQHYGSPAFPQIVVSMSISPLLVLSLAGLNAVEKWKTMVGPYGLIREEWFYPYSVRTRFGLQGDIADVVHASENIVEGRKENRYFYPRSILEPILIDEEKVTDFIGLYVRETLLKGLTQLLRVKPIDPVLFLAEWLLLNNPYQPSFPEKVALSPL